MEWVRDVAAKRQFERFAAETSDLLLRTGYLMTGDTREAEDLVQETFLQVARRWHKVRSMDHPVAYARRILINLVLHDAHRRSRQKAELQTQATGLGSCDAGAARALRQVDDLAEFRWALAQLPARQRAVLMLRYWAELPIAEVAGILGCSEGTVTSTASRAAARLAGALTYGEPPAPEPAAPAGEKCAVITNEFENELRTTLARAAADFENIEQAQQRLIQQDYHPRTGDRRRAGLAVVLATAATAITATVLALSPAGAHSSRTETVRLAAWTVTKKPDGSIKVTVRQMLDPGKLQQQLRAFGVPANVSVYHAKRDGPQGWDYSDDAIPSCQIDRGLMDSNSLVGKVFFSSHPLGAGPGQLFTVWISPSAIPAGLGVALQVGVTGTPSHDPPSVSIYLVKASPQCTGTGQ